jgi:hypothetical protein
MLTNATYPDLTTAIALSYLPKTFRDAITLTRKLRIRYLWIDCLCIVQDDPQDWEKEASQMSDVYSNSYLTISAADSNDSNAGCYPARQRGPYVSPDSIALGYNTPRHTYRPEAFHFGVTDLKTNSISTMSFFHEWMPAASIHWKKPYLIGIYGKQFDPVSREHISSRAWTLQERLLSPRLIHFGRDQMYWECAAYTRAEDGALFAPTGQMSQVIAKQLIPFEEHGFGTAAGLSLIPGVAPGRADDKGRWDNGWLSTIQDFSQRKLTHETDKLPAIAGLARIMASSTGDVYHAGVWRNHLLEDLHWRTYPQEEFIAYTGVGKLSKGKILGEVKRTQSYRAPSWSWASIEAPIKFVGLHFNHLVAEWEKISTTPSGLDDYSKVGSGHLMIQVSTGSDWRWHAFVLTQFPTGTFISSQDSSAAKHLGQAR